MVVLSQAPTGAVGALSSSKSSFNSPLKFTNPISLPKNSQKSLTLNASNADRTSVHSSSPPANPSLSTPSPSQSPPQPPTQFTVVDQESVPLEGVIQFEKPDFSSRIDKWGRLALLAGGDVFALVLFSAIGRLNHGFSVFDYETLRTADPFIAGWFLSAYFLGGFGDDGRGMNGFSKAVAAAAKSWALGIPLGLIIRGLASGHIPPFSFVAVTMGSTAVLLVGWRTILLSILPSSKSKKNDVYRRGSPFELFENAKSFDLC
ncbi:Protein of unknown function DUF3054 [Dillenia turbinata]|uniref:Transmembrane protein n=1 Tax=Dillenia turbinata TaxID=194707 RepID=A0AAN8VQV2_9MAGN